MLQIGTNGTTVTVTVTTNGTGRVLRLSSDTTITWTIEYDLLATASQATYNSPVVAGNAVSVTLSNPDISISTLTHTLTFSMGTYSHNASLGLGVTTYQYTIPVTWINAIPNAESGLCVLSVSTYSGGSLIGSRSYSITVQVPSGIGPTLGSLTTTRIDHSVPASFDAYVQSKSGVTITANNCTGAYGSTITKYVISGGMSATQPTNAFMLDPIQTSGNITFTVTITDSRGRTASQSVAIYVYPYSVPSISEATAFKSTSTGEHSTTGTYLAVKLTATFTPIDNKNTLSLSVYYREMGGSTWTFGANLTNGVQSIIGGSLDPYQNYEVRFVAEDALSSVDTIVDINSVVYTLHFKNGGKGMGIGQLSTLDDTLQISEDWTILHGSYVVPRIVFSATQPTGEAGLIWLKPIT